MTTFLLAAVLAASPGLLGPVEDVMDNLSLGPTVSALALVDGNGVAPAFGAGLELMFFELEKTYEPRCLEHRRSEREQLGAEEGAALDDFLEDVQQECPAIEQHWKLSVSLGAELEVAVRAERELSIRAWGTWFTIFRTLALGLNGSAVFADRGGQSVTGARLGADLSYSFRLGKKGFRPVLQPFIRGEAAVIRRDALTDQLGAGIRFLFDI